MYTLSVEPVDTFISPSPAKELVQLLDNALSFEPEGAGYFRNTHWDGKVHLYNKTRQSFPTGLLIRVCSLLREFGYQFRLESRLPKTEPNAQFNFLGQLRDYQEEDLRIMDIRTKKRGVVWAVTGYGKSVFMMRLISEIQLKPVLILTDAKDLMYQTAGFIRQFLGVEPGLFGSGHKDLDSDITVAIIDSIWESFSKKASNKTPLDWKVCEYIRKVPVVITDECQSVPAKTFYRVHRQMYRAEYKIGLSGTPWRDDGYTLYIEAAIGPVLVQRPAQDLITRGYLARPFILMLPVKKVGDQPWNWQRWGQSHNRTYNQIYDTYVVQNSYRNELIYNILSDKRLLPALILVQRLEHGHILHRELGARGFNVKYLKGEDSDTVRHEIFNNFRNGNVEVLITTQIGNVGIDLPNIKCLVIAGAGKSSVLTYQRVGRALRACPGKSKVLIVDFRDYVRYLRSHSDERRRLYEAVGYEVRVLGDADEVQRHLQQYHTEEGNSHPVSQSPGLVSK